MKYLKRWESLLNESEISDTLEDIFLDLKDSNNNFHMRIMDYKNKTIITPMRPIIDPNFIKEGDIVILISKFTNYGVRVNRQIFGVEEVEEVIWRMINYMSSLGYKNEILSKLKPSDPERELIMSEGDYTRYKTGKQEWRMKYPINLIQIKFVK